MPPATNAFRVLVALRAGPADPGALALAHDRRERGHQTARARGPGFGAVGAHARTAHREPVGHDDQLVFARARELSRFERPRLGWGFDPRLGWGFDRRLRERGMRHVLSPVTICGTSWLYRSRPPRRMSRAAQRGDPAPYSIVSPDRVFSQVGRLTPTHRSLPPGSRHWALFLDVDGTLLDIAETPLDVSVPASVLLLLGRLQRELSGAVALVSGRSLDALDLLFRPLVLAAAGQHGFERRTAGGAVTRARNASAALARARLRLAGAEQAIPGVLVEDKGDTVAVHYRRAPDRERAVADRVDDAVRDLDAELELVPGKKVLEIRPRGVGKDKVVDAFMAEPPFRGRTPVFVGDDRTDEDGFAAVNRLGGHSIRVGTEGTSAAMHRLDDAAAVRAWLALLSTQIAEEREGEADDRGSAEGRG